MIRPLSLFAASALTIVLCIPASAVVVFDESTMGDLSTDPLAPTALDFSVGFNEIIGSVSTPDDTRDIITFTIDDGFQLVGLFQLQYEDLDIGGPGNTGFHAINLGDTTFVPSGTTAGSFLGGAHIVEVPSTTNLLETLAAAPQAGTGFTAPLGPGTYTYLIQQTGPELTGYTMSFEVAPIPEPTSLVLVGLGAAGLLVSARRFTR